MKHLLPSSFRDRQVNIDLVGVGGTGSRLLTRLAELHVYLRETGHPGLQVYAIDPKRITPASMGRTVFLPGEIGRHKVDILITRINAAYSAYGLMWRGFPALYDSNTWSTERDGRSPDIVVTCTDNLRSRVALRDGMWAGRAAPPRYWLDCGNDLGTGQVILGEPEWALDLANFGPDRRLPTVFDVFPDMRERAEREEPDPPSCSLATALDLQDLDINDHLAAWARTLLYRLFRYGGLDYHGVFVNLETGDARKLLVEPPRPPISVYPPMRRVLRRSARLAGAPGTRELVTAGGAA